MALPGPFELIIVSVLGPTGITIFFFFLFLQENHQSLKNHIDSMKDKLFYNNDECIEVETIKKSYVGICIPFSNLEYESMLLRRYEIKAEIEKSASILLRLKIFVVFIHIIFSLLFYVVISR